MKTTLAVLITALTLAFGSAALAADERAPSATLELSEGSVAAGIGFSWGSGTLTYQGKTYPVSVDGLTVGAVGVTKATVKGNVFGLKALKDFDGIYTAAEAGAAVGEGAGATQMVNEHGVAIEMISTTEGVKLTLGSGGVKLRVKQ